MLELVPVESLDRKQSDGCNEIVIKYLNILINQTKSCKRSINLTIGCHLESGIVAFIIVVINLHH